MGGNFARRGCRQTSSVVAAVRLEAVARMQFETADVHRPRRPDERDPRHLGVERSRRRDQHPDQRVVDGLGHIDRSTVQLDLSAAPIGQLDRRARGVHQRSASADLRSPRTTRRPPPWVTLDLLSAETDEGSTRCPGLTESSSTSAIGEAELAGDEPERAVLLGRSGEDADLGGTGWTTWTGTLAFDAGDASLPRARSNAGERAYLGSISVVEGWLNADFKSPDPSASRLVENDTTGKRATGPYLRRAHELHGTEPSVDVEVVGRAEKFDQAA